MNNIQLYNIKTKKLEKVKDEDVLDKLYFLTHIIPTDKKDNKDIDKLKKYISNLEYKMPLFDIYTSNIYLILKENIYTRVTYNFYRFPSKIVYNKLQEDLKKLKEKKSNDVLELRKLKKYQLMIDFLNKFDLDILEQTYYRMIYKYSIQLGKNLIFCKRPSFNKYIHNTKPYYSKTEIINLALNMNILKSFNINDFDKININELCNKVSNNDISNTILLSHQKHIIKNDLLGMIQYYSVQGSYYVNRYLRNLTNYSSQNSTLDDIIKPMTKLCLTSPSFDKDYILYRFVKEDSYLQKLKIGDIFTEYAFMSTTRDPFYRANTFEFGLILMKIKIPKNIKGVALCIETISHFSNEQEIIFPPNSKFKLVNRDENTVYYHTDPAFASKVKTRYEFEWISNDGEVEIKKDKEVKLKTVDFLTLNKSSSNNFNDCINDFADSILDVTSRFIIDIDKKKYIVNCEFYDSMGAYKRFYSITTSNGFSLYSLYNGYLLFMFEIGVVKDNIEMHINYYVKYNTLVKEEIISDESFIKFICHVAYYFNVNKVFIFSEYKPCSMLLFNKYQRYDKSNEKNNKNDDNDNADNADNADNEDKVLTGNYCLDFYDYLKNNKKKFMKTNIKSIEFRPVFSYYDLDLLKTISPDKLLDRSDDEIYQLYHKQFKLDYPKGSLSDYYIWLVENKCYLIESLIRRMYRFYTNENPFVRDYYILDPLTYLYNRGDINVYGSLSTNDLIIDRKRNDIPTNEYRLDKSIELSKLRYLEN